MQLMRENKKVSYDLTIRLRATNFNCPRKTEGGRPKARYINLGREILNEGNRTTVQGEE